MTQRLALCLLVATILALSSAQGGQPVEIHNGFVTGTIYRKFNEYQKRSYAMGVIDGIYLSPFFGASRTHLGWVEKCVQGMDDEQVAAVIDKFLKDHPERWHQTVHASVYAALLSACPREN